MWIHVYTVSVESSYKLMEIQYSCEHSGTHMYTYSASIEIKWSAEIDIIMNMFPIVCLIWSGLPVATGYVL